MFIQGLALSLLVAHASPTEDVIREAVELIKDGRTDEARTLLADTYARTGDPALLFSRAQVERRVGECEAARELFETFAAEAEPKDAKLARQLAENCEPAPGATPVPADSPATEEPPEVPPSEEVKADDAPEPEREREPAPAQPEPYDPPPLTRRPLPIVLLVTGLAVTGTGVGLLGQAQANPPEPDEEANEGAYGDRIRSHNLRTNLGIGFAVVGVGLVAAAATTWAILASREKRNRVSAGLGSLRVSF